MANDLRLNSGNMEELKVKVEILGGVMDMFYMDTLQACNYNLHDELIIESFELTEICLN